MAIWLFAFLIHEQADKDISSMVPNHIIDKVIDKIKKPVMKLNESITATKSFLNAMTQQQALELVSLQDSIKQHSDIVETLADCSERLNQASNQHVWVTFIIILLYRHQPACGTPTFKFDPTIHNIIFDNCKYMQKVVVH